MLKSNEIKKLNLSKEELRLIAKERSVKKYENISKSRLIKEINKSKPLEALKKPKEIVSSLLLTGKRSIGFKPRKKNKKNVYKPIKISGAFSDNFGEYLRKMIDDKRRIGEWKTQLIMKISFISSRNFSETRDMHSKFDNVEIMMGVDTNEIIKKRFNSLLQRYQKGLEESMRGSDFVFDYVQSLNYIFHKIDMKRFIY